MKPIIFHKGQRIGRLIILGRSHTKNGALYWNCMCDCGNKVCTAGFRLKNGKTRSCGCLSADLARERRSLDNGEASLNQVFAAYKRSAKIRDYSFEINKEEFHNIIKRKCFYCGSLPDNICKMKSGDCIYNGLDRIDNNKGYIFGNVVACCYRCNVMKNTMNLSEFREHINKIIKNWIMRIK